MIHVCLLTGQTGSSQLCSSASTPQKMAKESTENRDPNPRRSKDVDLHTCPASEPSWSVLLTSQ